MKTLQAFGLIWLCLSFSQGGLFAQQDSPEQMFIDTSYKAVNEPYQLDAGVKLTPPPFFLPFVQGVKSGFIHKGAASTIQVQVIDSVIYSFVAAALDEEELLRQNTILVEKDTLLTNHGQQAVFMVVAFTVNQNGKSADYQRMMLFTGDLTRTIWISANYPVVARNVLFNVLKESLLTVEF